MKKYAIKYQIGDMVQWYIIEAQNEEQANADFIKKANAFYGTNLLNKISFGSFSINILETKLF